MTSKIIISVMAISAAMLSACSSTETTETEEEDTRTLVRVQPVSTTTVSRELSYSANLEANEQVYYAPSLSGARIKKIYVEVGDRITKGQLLVEMDDNTLTQQELQLKNLEVEYNRAVKLNETGSISQQNYDAAVTQYEVAKRSYENLLENTRLIAPFNGYVTGKYMEDGELYTGGAYGGASKPAIVAVEQINPIKAYVNIAEQYYREVYKGMKVELTSDVYTDRTFTGTVNIVYPTIDASSRTFTVEILFPNSDETLRPGMYGTMSLKVGQTDAQVVQSMAILKMQGSNDRYCFIVKDGKAKRVSVKIINRYEDKLEIQGTDYDIQEGDLLVTTGQSNLVDGAEVKIVD